MKIMTTLGEMDELDLDRTEGSFENEQELTTWVEHRLIGSDKIIKRSVHVTIKESLTTSSAIGE